MRKTVVVNMARLVLAAVFVVAGFTKAVDPIGTQYKIADYLAAMGLGNNIPELATLSMAVAMAALEFTVGILLLFAIRRRIASQTALVVMLVMTPLTLWLALTNAVSNCGCFGDFLHLSNWQTFWKNTLLLACAAVVARWPSRMARFVSESNQWIVVNYTVLFILIVEAWCLYYLPIFDFRPYRIGVNIKQAMTIPEGAEQPEYQTTFVLEKDGQRREFSLDDYPEDTTWHFVDAKTVMTKKGYEPKIADFYVQSADGHDITDSLISQQGYSFMLIAPKLEKANDASLDRINELYEYCLEQGYPFVCLTSSSDDGVERWIENTGAEYPFAKADDTLLRTMIRSNPGLMLLKDGTIIGKWSHNDLPAIEQQYATQPLQQMAIGKSTTSTPTRQLIGMLLWFALPLTLLSLADRLWMWTKWVRRKKKKAVADSKAEA